MVKRRDSGTSSWIQVQARLWGMGPKARLSLLLSASVSFTCKMRILIVLPHGLGGVLKEVMYVQRLEQPWPTSGAGHVHCH